VGNERRRVSQAQLGQQDVAGRGDDIARAAAHSQLRPLQGHCFERHPDRVIAASALEDGARAELEVQHRPGLRLDLEGLISVPNRGASALGVRQNRRELVA